jgi:glycosyltransferase involved in cell wall biosynthesis
MPNVIVACPHGPPAWGLRADLPAELRRLVREAIQRSHPDGALERPVLWYLSPLAASWSLGWLDARAVVYDCMDELSQFAGAPRRLVEYERFLLRHADVVFTGGHELWTKKREQHANVHCFGCGVEFEHFAQAADGSAPIPPDIDFMQRPIIGWFGVVDERVDHPLVGEMARLRPDWSFAMIGPIVKIDPNVLTHAPNLYWMGGRDYATLPSYCRAFDVCFMAFALNAATEFINPTKALEYLATGRPCVSTPVRDVVRQYADVMDIERTPEGLVACIERALEAPDPERIRRGLERARAASWERTVEDMLGLVSAAVARRARAGAARIEPLGEAELEYAPTPGS